MPKTRLPYPPKCRRQMVDLVHAGRDPEDLPRSSNRPRSRSAIESLSPTLMRATERKQPIR
jgi:hypothetical protein